MCLAIPVQVTELLPDDMARVSLDGVTKVVSTALVEDLKVGRVDFAFVYWPDLDGLLQRYTALKAEHGAKMGERIEAGLRIRQISVRPQPLHPPEEEAAPRDANGRLFVFLGVRIAMLQAR